MQIIRGRKKLFLYAFGAMGVNLLNTIMGSYLCSAIIASGFVNLEAITNGDLLNAANLTLSHHTYLGFVEFVGGQATLTSGILVIAALWAVLSVVAKVIDGVIDIPMASLTDNLRTRWGRRRPSIVIGLIPLILSYCAFLLVPSTEPTIGNTIYYFAMLAIFYTSYTLVMVTYYATFTEIVDNEEDRRFLTNTKSIADIVYFILGFALIPVFLDTIKLNIRWVALIFLPLVFLILIPLFMMKEKSTKEGIDPDAQKEETVNIFKSVGYTFKNWKFILWMVCYSFITFGLQLFLNGINEYFKVAGMTMIYVMIAAFAPVPLTFIIYNKLNRKKGFGFAFQYTLIIFAISMLSMFGISYLEAGTLKTVLGIVSGLVASFSVGAMFAVAYSIPSKLAADDEKETGISHGAMYFAVQGLFAGIASGIGGGAVLTVLKSNTLFGKPGTYYITFIAAVACMISFILVFILPKTLRELGKEENVITREQ